MSDDLASARARDLEVVLGGVLASIHPAARDVSAHRFLTWTAITVQVDTDEALAAVADERGLGDRVIVVQHRLATWYRRASSR